MKNFIGLIEKIGQTKSLHQVDSQVQIFADIDCDHVSFKHLLKQSGDLVCLLMPDDDDEE